MTDEQRRRIHKIVYSCDDRAELAERIVTLEAENKSLREYATKLEQTNDQLSNDNCDLLCDTPEMQLFIDENAKLRELARYHVGAVEDCGCCHCPYYEDEGCPPETEPMREGCRLRSELRELGVEVDA